jgi:NTE family protein
MPHEASKFEETVVDRSSPPWPSEGLAAVVIAGAGARGAFEAGALSVLMPALFESLSDVVLLGTSAGAVNAALWAQYAQPGRPLQDIGEQVCEFWSELDIRRVYKPILWGLGRRALELSWLFGRVPSLLDTTPLAKHCRRTFLPQQLAQNIEKRSLAGVGLVATTCPDDGSGGRSHVFLQSRPDLRHPDPDPSSALDYLPTVLSHQHILASAAIPIAFPPVGVRDAEGGIGYYTDGGVRLNTPISPALDLNAQRLVIVSSHATEYPKVGNIAEEPDVVDIAAQSVHSILADGMIEDLRLLKRINSMVHQAKGQRLMDETAHPPRPYREVPVIAVAPQPGVLAQKARAFRPAFSFRAFEYAFVRNLLAGFGSGAGNDELLSYLLFNREFANKQIDLGKQCAKHELNRLELLVTT